MNLFQEQIALEEDAINSSVRQYSKNMGKPNVQLPAEFAFLKKVLPQYVEAILQYQTPGQGKKNTFSRQVLCAIQEPTEMAYLVLNRVISSCKGKTSQMPLQSLSIKIGEDLIDHVDYLKFREHCKVNQLKELKWAQLKSKTAPMWKRKHTISKAAESVGYTIPVDNFNDVDKFKVGERALDLLLTSTQMFTFNKGYSSKRNECMYLKPNAETEEWLNDIHTLCAIARPRYLPSVIEPKQWADLVDGGYYIKRGKSALKLLRTRQELNHQKNASTDLTEVFQALNRIQGTAWTINKAILNVMEQSNLLPTVEDISIPDALTDTPWDYDRLTLQMPATMRRNAKARALAFSKKTSVTSQAFAAKQSLEAAQQMSKYDKIYFPCNLDYRGRVYPVPSYLNPQGDDVAKGLLMFATGKPLGEHGASWLAIHGANCWGNNVDKGTFEQRLDFIRTHTRVILESASEPLKTAFWRGAEDKWQFLAFCMEWAGYQKQGKSFISHLSISMDGSCNGLQHLSAILKDAQGGALVNLTASIVPSDVYTIVKDYSSEQVAQMASRGDEKAALWVGLVDRKIVKRPTMTQGYGVTPAGIKNQIKGELSKRGKSYDKLTSTIYQSSEFLAGVVGGTIKDLMPGVAHVKDYLREVAKIFSEDNLPITWTTPVGLVCVQQRFKQRQIVVESFYGVAKLKGLSKGRSKLTMNLDTDKLDKAEQANALVPNVIHSMDASHLMKTVNSCSREGITDFHAIHDSYGTHACNVETLHRIIREEFVALYSGDYLLKLSKQFISQLPPKLAQKALKAEQEVLAKMGTLDLDKVKDSDYFFA